MKISMKKQNTILIITLLLMIYISGITRTLEKFFITMILADLGTFILGLTLIANNLYRLTKLRILKIVTNYMYFWGLFGFLLIVPHTGITGIVTREIRNGEFNVGWGYLLVPTLSFVILVFAALTSIRRFQPIVWKKFHKILWLSAPLTTVHLLYIADYVLSAFFIIAMIIPLIGVFLQSKKHLHNVFKKQLVMLIAGIILSLMMVYYLELLTNTLYFILAFVPLAMLLILKNKFKDNLEISSVIKKYLIFAVIIIILIIILPIIKR